MFAPAAKGSVDDRARLIDPLRFGANRVRDDIAQSRAECPHPGRIISGYARVPLGGELILGEAESPERVEHGARASSVVGCRRGGGCGACLDVHEHRHAIGGHLRLLPWPEETERREARCSGRRCLRRDDSPRCQVPSE